MKRVLLAPALFALAVTLGLTARGVIIDVHVYNFDFSANPKGGLVVDPVINLGDTIRWGFDEGFHSVESVSGSLESFSSGAPGSDTQPDYLHIFNQVGTFSYYCVVHGSDNGNGTASGMSGIVTVVPEPEQCGLALATGLLGVAIAWRRGRGRASHSRR